MDDGWMMFVSLHVFFVSVRSAVSFQWEELEGRFVSCQPSLAGSAANGMTACWAVCLLSASNMCEGVCVWGWGGMVQSLLGFISGSIHVGGLFNISLISFRPDRCSLL